MAERNLVAKLNSGDASPSVPIGIEFYFASYDGASVTFTGTHPCTGVTTDNEFSRAPLPTVNGVNWNNNIQSFQTLNNCWQRMWDNPNCTGLPHDFSGDTEDLGIARDRTECIEWS